MEDEPSFKEKEAALLNEIASLYTKLNQVREKRAKVEQESSSHAEAIDQVGTSGGNERKRRILLVTRTLPFTLIAEEEQLQWRAEFPENISLDSALETYLNLHENYDCVWIGSIHGEVEPSEQNTLKEQLLMDRNYFPVFLDPKREKLFYQGFCKTVMWPLFHSCPPTSEDQLISHEIDGGEEDHNVEKMWQAYVAVNQAFADAVQEVYEEGDLVWIQGYHLTLLPQMVKNLYPNETLHIGYFMHIPFPSSELYRIMNNREEILTGMLGADLIGFQTYEYARHFQSAAVRLLGLESTHKGVDVDGHFARVTICPVGIDAEKYISLSRSEAVLEKINQMKQQFAGKKIILGVDQLDLTKGMVHKLLAVEELFTLRPELSKEVVFLQIATGHPGLFDTPLGSQVESLVSRINSKLQDLGAEGPVQYLSQDISVESLIALYCLADLLVITPVRDGMNTIPFEFVVCREACAKHARVILSEFAGCAQALGGAGAILVNPWNTEELQDALLVSLQENDNVMQVHQRMYSYVSTFTTRKWADNYLEQLHECTEESAVAVSGRELSRRDMTSAYMRSSRRLIFLNYEGVLAAESSIPELAYPPQELIWQLSMLARDSRNTVVLVCARSTSVCEQWFAGLLGRIVLAAEYGVYVKWIGEDEPWRCMVPDLDLSWWEHVMPLLEYYTERTPGAFIERKDSSVAWHYRDCDLDHGIWQASELLVSLREITRSLPVSVVPGNRYLEVRPQKVSKASLFERIWEFMNWASMSPDEEPLTTDYFGNSIAELQSPLLKPQAALKTTTSKRDEPFSQMSESELMKDVKATRSLSMKEMDMGLADGGDTDAVSSDDTTTSEPLAVDFLLVIASGEDRMDEDLFAELVPPPIDLEAYCHQLEKEEMMDRIDLSEHRVFTPRHDLQSSSASGYSLDDLAGDEMSLTRRLLRRQNSGGDIGSSLVTNVSGVHIPSGSVTSVGATPTEADFLNISTLAPLYHHAAAAAAAATAKPAISEDAASMFPRTLLSNTPTIARREEITEKSKFTPRRDFPPSAALFKALRTKYGDNFGIHKIPDTAAACWALVCPPTARARLEDSSSASVSSVGAAPGSDALSDSSSVKGLIGPESTAKSGADAEVIADDGMTTSLTADGSVNSSVLSTTPAPSDEEYHGGEVSSFLTHHPYSEGEEKYNPREEFAGNDVSSETDTYRFPINTFVCTLGRKLSQAPYYIKNSADLFQLLQEMGLSSHIRNQRSILSGSD